VKLMRLLGTNFWHRGEVCLQDVTALGKDALLPLARICRPRQCRGPVVSWRRRGILPARKMVAPGSSREREKTVWTGYGEHDFTVGRHRQRPYGPTRPRPAPGASTSTREWARRSAGPEKSRNGPPPFSQRPPAAACPTSSRAFPGPMMPKYAPLAAASLGAGGYIDPTLRLVRGPPLVAADAGGFNAPTSITGGVGWFGTGGFATSPDCR